MDPKEVLRVQDMRRNELVAEVAEEGKKCSVLVVVAVEALDQAVIHIDMENCMTGKNYRVFVGLGVAEHLNKVMDVVAVVVE